MPQPKKPRSEIDSAERKLGDLIEKRNTMNKEAEAVKMERNQINDAKRKLIDEAQELRNKQRDLVSKRREHIKLRNRYQQQAKALIEQKKKRTSKIYPSLPAEVEARRAEVKLLENRQQTQPLSVKAERDLIDDIRKKKENLANLEKQLTEQSELNKEVGEMDGNIDDLFKKADTEHAKVVELSKEIDKLYEGTNKLFNEVAHLKAEGDKKHKEFLKIKEKANKFHEKAQEMRKKILSLRKEKMEDRQETRRILREQKKEVEAALADPEKIEKKLDDDLDTLKKGQKIELK
jgi:uncharacterized coiled-coil DUF342 family protein